MQMQLSFARDRGEPSPSTLEKVSPACQLPTTQHNSEAIKIMQRRLLVP